MRTVTIPTWKALEWSPPVLALEGAVGADCRVGLIALWSLAAEHGPGPHAPAAIERAVAWRGEGGALVDALEAGGWVRRDDDGLVIQPWSEVLGEGSPPVDETQEQRRRRQTRERVRRYRECRSQGVTQRNAPVTLCNASVTLGNATVTLGNANGNADVTLRNANTPPSRARTSSSGSFLQKEKDKNRAEEEENVVSIAAIDPVDLETQAILAALDCTPSEAADGSAATPAPDAAGTGGGQERPVVALGEAIDPWSGSVPVQPDDRAPKANHGDRPAKGRRKGGRKAAIDLAAVDGSVRQVWDAYAEVVGTRVVLSVERSELIAARLRDGWTVDELVSAVRGFGKSAWHFGANREGTRYTSIELWLRDAQHVEQGLGFHREAAKAAPVLKDNERMINGNKLVVAPSLSGIEEKFRRYFEEKRRQEAEQAQGGQA